MFWFVPLFLFLSPKHIFSLVSQRGTWASTSSSAVETKTKYTSGTVQVNNRKDKNKSQISQRDWNIIDIAEIEALNKNTSKSPPSWSWEINTYTVLER